MKIVYVDGASLVITVRDFHKKIGQPIDDFDYVAFLRQFDGRRTFFYHAWPAKPTTRESGRQVQYDKECADLDSMFQKLAQSDGFFVRTGVRKWSKNGKDRKQKAVDVLLAVDVVSDASSQLCSEATIIASDLDFYPVLESLQKTSTHSKLIYRRPTTDQDLIDAADSAKFIGFDCLSKGLSESLRVELSSGNVDLAQRPLSNEEREKSFIVTLRGQELAFIEVPGSETVVFYGGSRNTWAHIEYGIEQIAGPGTRDAAQVLLEWERHVAGAHGASKNP